MNRYQSLRESVAGLRCPRKTRGISACRPRLACVASAMVEVTSSLQMSNRLFRVSGLGVPPALRRRLARMRPAATSSACILARFQELLERPANDGCPADEPGMSVGELADPQGAETDDVLLTVFRWGSCVMSGAGARPRRESSRACRPHRAHPCRVLWTRSNGPATVSPVETTRGRGAVRADGVREAVRRPALPA